VDVPAATAVTIPVEDPIVATLVVKLVHVPPGVAFDSVVVLPWQTLRVPEIAVGAALTVTVVVL
jgi:hypothetical protein